MTTSGKDQTTSAWHARQQPRAALTWRTSSRRPRLGLWLSSSVAALAAAMCSLALAPAAGASSPHLDGVVPAPASRPAAFAASRDGAIVLVSSTTGRVLRALTTGPPGTGDSQPYLADSGQTVVFVRSTGTCSSSILAVRLRSGHTSVLVPRTTGVLSQPRLSPDGRRLAYQLNNCSAGRPALMVRTLQTGATHPIAMPYQGQANDYAFTPDGRRLITTVSFLTATNQVTYQVRSIPANARSAAAGRVLQGVPEAGCSAGSLTEIGRSGYVAVDQYCPATGKETVLKVDSRNGRSAGRLALVPASEVGLDGVDFDAAGRYLLLQGESGNVYTVNHATVTVIATGFESATW
jgi:dipeptidyl aminopeptidase/acylaminoacyl peptidase